MKQKDLIIIIVAVFIAGFASLFISKKLFANEKDRSVQVKIVDKVTTDFTDPSKQYFNENSRNPTQIIDLRDVQKQNQ